VRARRSWIHGRGPRHNAPRLRALRRRSQHRYARRHRRRWIRGQTAPRPQRRGRSRLEGCRHVPSESQTDSHREELGP
jgi:hypothetical protein